MPPDSVRMPDVALGRQARELEELRNARFERGRAAMPK